MEKALLTRLDSICARKIELEQNLSDPEIIKNHQKFIEQSKELSELTPITECFREIKKKQNDIIGAKELLLDSDPNIKKLGEEELIVIKNELIELETNLKKMLISNDPDDQANIFLEIRAGTGGDEAALFVNDLLRMYLKFSERQKWKAEIISKSEGEIGGFKEIVCKISGKDVYSKLKFESGAHRVQRVPETESQGRVHTSACTVAVLPEVSEVDSIEINQSDLRIDTYRASGAGGQHVNKTDSAIRITHLPTGTVIECQDERSQHKNRARAMSLLNAKLLSNEKEKQRREQADTRKSLVGSGDRSERIRTYNFPQGRMTDHRVNLTLYKIEQILDGELEMVINPLQEEHQLNLMSNITEKN
tara:strand:+ start:2006 stop:3094 length:1089 start_codon:yes stop_codon:yes gene_type:complete